MTDYSKLSDFEINHAVAKATGLNLPNPSSLLYNKTGKWELFDPCSSWADAGPIILDNKISIIFQKEMHGDPDKEWITALSMCGKYEHAPLNKPLRAAMVVYLMMRDKS